MEKFIITIHKAVSFEEQEDIYEAEDGKRYYSTYGIPEGVKYKKKQQSTGKVGWNKDQIYMQEVEALALEQVIKAVNHLV